MHSSHPVNTEGTNTAPYLEFCMCWSSFVSGTPHSFQQRGQHGVHKGGSWITRNGEGLERGGAMSYSAAPISPRNHWIELLCSFRFPWKW